MKLSPALIIAWSQQLLLLLNAHIPLNQALYLLSLSCPHHHLKTLSQSLYHQINNGTPLSLALKKQDQIFDSTYCYLITAGEKSGKISIMLENIIIEKKRQEQLKAQMLKAFIYPSLVLLTGFGVLILLFIYAIPQMAGVFSQLNHPLPAPTRLVLAISSVVTGSIIPILIILIGLCSGFYLLARYSPLFLLWCSQQYWKSPTSLFSRYSTLILFSGTLSTLLSAGIPIVPACEASISALSQPFVKQRLNIALTLIHQGQSFSYALEQTQLFPALAIHLWKMGEYTGKLHTLLYDTAVYYQQQLQVLTDRLTALLEPLLLIILGIMIGGIVIALYLPLFNMGLMIGH